MDWRHATSLHSWQMVQQARGGSIQFLGMKLL
jgi:hypothetical protein